MKNKKVIALICALSMIFSMFSMMAVRAEGELGVALDGSLSEDGKTVTVEVTLVGVEDNTVRSAQINLNVPDGVTNKSQISAVCEGNADVKYSPNLVGTEARMSFALQTAGVIEGGKLATITFDLGDTPLATDYTATLATGSALMTPNYGNTMIGNGGTMAAATTDVAKWKDPNAKSEATARPAEEEEPETPKDVTTDNLGINLEAEVNKDNNIVTVYATLAGVEDNTVRSAQINLTVPDGVTNKSQISAVCEGNADVKYSPNLVGTEARMSFALQTAGVIEDGKLATITFDLGENTLDDTYVAKLVDGSAIMTPNYGNAMIGNGGTMATTQAVVNPAQADKGTPTQVALSDYMGKDTTTGKSAAEVAEAYEADETKVQPLYITVDVTKEDDNGDRVPAVYGTDYEAVYNGEVLSEAAYNNLIHGYTDDDISDVIKGLKFNVYNTAKNAKINTTLQAVGDDTQLVNDQTKEDVSTTPDTYVASNIALKDSGAKTATLGKEVTNTITVTPGSKNGEAYAYEAVTFKLTDESVSKLNLPGVQITYTPAVGVAAAEPATVTIASSTATELPVAVDGKYTVKFTAGSEGKVSYTVSYVGYDNKGVANTTPKTATVTYTVSATSTDNNNGGGGSSSGSSSGGGGAIATGYQGGSTAGLPGSASFTDLNDAPWAVDAVTMLAYQNIISGYEDNTFRPNGNITRAEYAQILINAIGHNGDSADTYFDDVPTDAWFYHNVAVASQLGIVSGYGDGNFGPYDLITREQMALMTQKAAQVMNVNLGAKTSASFSDDASIADWSRDAVYTLANAGIINGMDDGSYFAPQANATRAQAAVIIYNTFIK